MSTHEFLLVDTILLTIIHPQRVPGAKPRPAEVILVGAWRR